MNESFINKNLIPKDIPEVDENNSEKLDIKFRLAGPDDWEKCKKIRIMSLASDDGRMLGVTAKNKEKLLKKEENKSEDEWRAELSDVNKITFLPENGEDSIGISRATKARNNAWNLHNTYIEKAFRDKGFGKKLFAERLREIIKRGGTEARGFIKIDNITNLHIVECFGAKIVNKVFALTKYGIRSKNYKVIELDLTNPEVIKKIGEVLNEG